MIISADNLAKQPKKINNRTDIMPPLFAKASPSPIAPAPIILLTGIKILCSQLARVPID